MTFPCFDATTSVRKAPKRHWRPRVETREETRAKRRQQISWSSLHADRCLLLLPQPALSGHVHSRITLHHTIIDLTAFNRITVKPKKSSERQAVLSSVCHNASISLAQGEQTNSL